MKHHLLTMILMALVAGPGQAAETNHAHQHPAAASSVASLSEGTVKKIDLAKGTVTLTHGPLLNLAMDPMTMAFSVKDSAWLSRWQPGDRIRFFADMVKGRITVMRWEPAS